MKRTISIIAGTYVLLLATIFALSWALHRERSRRRLSLAKIPEKVRQEVSDLASRATKTAEDLNVLVAKGVTEAKTIAERAATVLR